MTAQVSKIHGGNVQRWKPPICKHDNSVNNNWGLSCLWVSYRVAVCGRFPLETNKEINLSRHHGCVDFGGMSHLGLKWPLTSMYLICFNFDFEILKSRCALLTPICWLPKIDVPRGFQFIAFQKIDVPVELWYIDFWSATDCVWQRYVDFVDIAKCGFDDIFILNVKIHCLWHSLA